MSVTPTFGEALTFVIRLWCEPNASGNDRWHGRVEHVASQEVLYVEDLGEIAPFLQLWMSGSEDPATTGQI
jgi:hypothetical protein